MYLFSLPLMNRSTIYQTMKQEIFEKKQKLLFLIWPRESGKTTILKHLREDKNFSFPCIYINFEKDLLTQQFETSQDIIYYFQITHGIDVHKPSLILLNEIQYSKNTPTLLLEITQNPLYHIIIVATGTYLWHQNQLVTTIPNPWNSIIYVPPFSFFEFLEARNIHTTYISLDKASKIVLQQIKSLRDEYCLRWWYPAVVFATTEEQKRNAFKKIMQKIIDKDLSFWFSWEDYVKFNRFLSIATTLHGQRLKIIPLARTLWYSTKLVSKYIDFMAKSHLITLVYPRSQDKKKELSKSALVFWSDSGLLHYIQDILSQKIITPITAKWVIINERVKMPRHTIHYYQKTNGSLVDIVGQTENNLYCIDISGWISTTYPKVFRHLPHPLSSYIHIKCNNSDAPKQSLSHLTIPACLISLLP